MVPLIALLSCTAAPVADSGVYRLVSIGTAPLNAPVTLRLVAPDQIAGTGPCNSYSARLARPLPDFDSMELTATEIGCAGLAAEGEFFASLATMTRAETNANTLTFSNDLGASMLFAQP